MTDREVYAVGWAGACLVAGIALGWAAHPAPTVPELPAPRAQVVVVHDDGCLEDETGVVLAGEPGEPGLSWKCVEVSP